MQGAVSAGVMEMDKFTEEVRQRRRRGRQIGAQLGQIIDQVQALSDALRRGQRRDAQPVAGRAQINEAMVQLTEGAGKTAASLKEFDNATGTCAAPWRD